MGPLILMAHRFIAVDSCVWLCGTPHPVNKLEHCACLCDEFGAEVCVLVVGDESRSVRLPLVRDFP